MKKLLAIKGIGQITAWWLRAEVGRFDGFKKGKQLARFCGLSPCNRSSGMRVADSGLVWAGHPQLKAVLIEAAHRLARYQTRWRESPRGGQTRQRGVGGGRQRWVRSLLHEMK